MSQSETLHLSKMAGKSVEPSLAEFTSELKQTRKTWDAVVREVLRDYAKANLLPPWVPRAFVPIIPGMYIRINPRGEFYGYATWSMFGVEVRVYPQSAALFDPLDVRGSSWWGPKKGYDDERYLILEFIRKRVTRL